MFILKLPFTTISINGYKVETDISITDKSQMERNMASTSYTYTEADKIYCGLIFVGFYALGSILVGVGGYY